MLAAGVSSKRFSKLAVFPNYFIVKHLHRLERVNGIEPSLQDSEAHLNRSEFVFWTARRFHPAASAACAGVLVFETMCK